MAAAFLRVFVLWGLLLCLCLSGSRAQSPSGDSTSVDTLRVQWERDLPPLTVTASQIPTSPADAPARITVLDSAALARTGAQSVANLLDARAGVHVRRYGDGGLATPALRGTGASQTALLLDGQSISNPQIGHLDLSLLPTLLLRSVEVMHGPASALHGSNGLGGAIHLRTMRPQSSMQVRGAMHVGAYGERGADLLVNSPVGPYTSVLAAAEYQSTDGDFPYVDEARYPAQTVRRQNADRARQSMFGSVRTSVDDHQIRVSGWATWSEQGLPSAASTTSTRERQWDTQVRLWAQDHMPLGNGSLTFKGMTQHSRIRYKNPAQDLDQTGRTWVHSLKTTAQTPLTERWTTASGLEGSIAKATHPRLEVPATQKHSSVFVEGTGRYGRVRLYPALRTDSYWMPADEFRSALSPRIGLNWSPLPQWPEVHLKGQFGRAFRVPTFNDRYWSPGGNPDLRPERSWGGDLGVWIGQTRGHVEFTAFGHHRRNEIVWRPSGDGYWAPINVGRVRALGGEVSGDWGWSLTPGLALDLGFTYTYTDARNRTTPGAPSYNEQVRYVPRDQMKTHATLSWGPASLTVHGRYTGQRPLTSDGRQFLDEYVTANTQLQLEHSFSGIRTALSVQVENFLDTNYRSIGNRPMPPRHARIRLLLAPY